MKDQADRGTATSIKPGRPSLYDDVAGTTHTSEVFSILDALEAPAKKSMAVRWVLGLGVISVLGVVLLFYSAKRAEGSFARQSNLVLWTQALDWKSDKATLREPEALTTLPTVDTDMVPKTAQGYTSPAVATVVEVSPASLESPTAATLDGDKQDQQATRSVDTDIKTSAAQIADASTPLPAIQPSSRHAGQESNTKAKSGKSKSVRPASSPAIRSSAKATHAPTMQRPGKKTDRDVELIAALLSHVGVAGNGMREPASVPARKANAMTRESPMAAPGKNGGMLNLRRDVVLQSAGDTTDTLVKRCEALGFFEGQLCRLRICSGLWGKEAACPASNLDRSDS